jgi:CTP-dependent riboflavin kinase
VRVFQGTVRSGYGVAGKNLIGQHHLIESRTGLRDLVEGTLNVAIASPYYVKPIAKLTRTEYREEILFQRCRVGGVRCLIMRPETHEAGAAHGPSHLEIMSDRHLRTSMGLKDGSVMAVEVEGDDNWWNGNAT